jgi:mono/diheme cytochrome c family protein
MATRRNARGTSNRRSGGGFGTFLLGFIFAVVLAVAGFWLNLRFGHPSRTLLAVAGPLAPARHAPTRFDIAEHRSPTPPAPAKPAPVQPAPAQPAPAPAYAEPPFGISEDGFEAAARLYHANCAVCHGTPAGRSALKLSPPALQMWQKLPNSTQVGVSGHIPGEIESRIANGVEHTGMPAYRTILTGTQRWQLALLLKNADQPLPEPVSRLLNEPVGGGGSR